MFEPELFRKQFHCIEESTCDMCGTFRQPHSDSAPPPLVTPLRGGYSFTSCNDRTGFFETEALTRENFFLIFDI